MKISARDKLKGRIVEVRKGQTTAHVRIDVDGTIVTAAITNGAVGERGPKAGQDASAVVKASAVMVAVDGWLEPWSAATRSAPARSRSPPAAERCRARLHRPHPHALDRPARLPAPGPA